MTIVFIFLVLYMIAFFKDMLTKAFQGSIFDIVALCFFITWVAYWIYKFND